eukprot:1372238-Amorphochlora_amoeboformis.AAC.1
MLSIVNEYVLCTLRLHNAFARVGHDTGEHSWTRLSGPSSILLLLFDARCSMFDARCSMLDGRCSMLDTRCS